MNANDKAKIVAQLINDFDFDLAYKVAVICDMGWWKSPQHMREDALSDIHTMIDNNYDEVSSGGLGAYREKSDEFTGYYLKFIPICSIVLREEK